MSLEDHCQALCTLQLSWEAQVHERLGYFPSGFRECCREFLTAYLASVEQKMKEEVSMVEAAKTKLSLSQEPDDSTC